MDLEVPHASRGRNREPAWWNDEESRPVLQKCKILLNPGLKCSTLYQIALGLVHEVTKYKIL